MLKFREYLKEYSYGDVVSKNKLDAEEIAGFWIKIFENQKKYELSQIPDYKHYQFFKAGRGPMNTVLYLAIDQKNDKLEVEVSLKKSQIFLKDIKKNIKKDTFYVQMLAAVKGNTLKANEFYYHILKNEKIAIASKEQTKGGFITWERLGKMPGIEVFGFLDTHDIAKSLKREFIKFYNQREISKFAKDHGQLESTLINRITMVAHAK